MKLVSLDQLYRMTAYIYSEQNSIRPVATTFAHFVEVCGMLTIHDRRKKREGLEFVDIICKAFGWYFPLMAKLRVKSIEDLVFRKYPYVCPYCRKEPHQDAICKIVRGTDATVDHSSLRTHYETNRSRRPRTLDDWQLMFQHIYPRSVDGGGARSTLGLFEELGEMAEAVRVFERYPKYLAGEAADVFSYLMGITNEHMLREAQDSGHSFSLHDEFLKRYPGLCSGCGNRVCICPSIPRSTVGRLTKELDIGMEEQLFEDNDDDMISAGREAAGEVIHSIGTYKQLAEGFPADRGDANTALILLTTKLAAAVSPTDPRLAAQFQNAANELVASATEAGSKQATKYLASHENLMAALGVAWRIAGDADKPPGASRATALEFALGTSYAKLRVLFVHATPANAEVLRVSAELRAMRESIQLAGRTADIEIDDLPAANIDDLRRALLSKNFEIVHFSGHADSSSLVFENSNGDASSVSLDGIAEMLLQYPRIQCVILNACDSLANFTKPIAKYTIGMKASLDDDSAIEFARGFYDAICRGKTIEFAVDEGKRAATLKGLEPPPTKLILAQKAILAS